MTVVWNRELSGQLSWHWERQLRPRLAGLSDEEYFWEPVDGCWNVRRRGASGARTGAGSGEFTIDFEFPQPEPPPVTTVAWRLGHLIVGVLGARVASHFGGPAVDYHRHDYAGTARAALDQLDAGYAAWTEGVRGLGEEGLARPCGDAEPYPELTMAALVLHIHREVIHHGAEIALLRDLHRAR